MAHTQFASITPEPVSLDLRSDGDRLRSLLLEELAAQGVASTGSGFTSGRTLDGMAIAHYRLTIRSEALASELLIVPVSNNAALFVVQSDVDVHESQVEPWRAALASALPRLRDPLPEREWWAVIGPVDATGRRQRLGAAAQVGELRLEPSPSTYAEALEPSAGRALSVGEVRESQLVVVRGASRGHDAFEAGAAGSRALHRLCAVLSVAWGGTWAVRQSPSGFPLDSSQLPASRWPLVGPFPPDDLLQAEAVSVPDWTPTALARLESEASLLSAALSYHHGLLMEDRHPSYAHLAYVAAIEGLGARYVDLKRCGCCDACRLETGAGERFRAGLRLVCSEDEYQRLRKTYVTRSKTAHEGRLFGGEDLAGAIFSVSMFAIEDWRMFLLATVRPLRIVARRLMKLGLTGQLPPRVPSAQVPARAE